MSSFFCIVLNFLFLSPRYSCFLVYYRLGLSSYFLALCVLSCLVLSRGGPQEDALRWGLDVVVGTPGRLLDHVGRNTLRLSDTEFLILDEADQMLDMGFKEEMEKVCILGVYLGYSLDVSWLCISGVVWPCRGYVLGSSCLA